MAITTKENKKILKEKILDDLNRFYYNGEEYTIHDESQVESILDYLKITLEVLSEKLRKPALNKAFDELKDKKHEH